MALAEHEVVQQEVTQNMTVRLTEAQTATLRQAAEAKGQSVEEFTASAALQAANTALTPANAQVLPPTRSFASVLGIFRDEPLMEALMERIHEERRIQMEQEAEAAE